jgi:hypothetical protein
MRAALLAAALVLVSAAPASAAPELVKLGDFQSPVHVASPPGDDRLFVVEQGGLVKIVGGGTFLDVTGLTSGGGEEGLLSIAFPPDYASSGYFYVFLTSSDGNQLRVIEFNRSADPNVADPNSARPVLAVDHTTAGNHNGGQLQFGPDGFLYVSTGDGGSTPQNARNLTSELGKILRVDARTGAAAPGNPFGTRVWAYGLRNPWRFTFDRATGDLLIGDVGEVTWEEVNWARAPNAGAGLDYGWNCAEGTSGNCGTPPAFARNHSAGYQAIIGGYIVRDPGLPSLNGRYLYGDAALGALRSVVLPDTDDRPEPLQVAALSSFGEDRCGRLYATSLAGPVYRIQEGAPTPCAFTAPDASAPNVRVRFRGVKRRRLRVLLRCDEACRVTVNSRMRRVRRLKARHRSLAANRRAIVRVKMSRKVARRMRRALARRGYVRVVVRVRAVDAAGNARVVTRRGRIKRR